MKSLNSFKKDIQKCSRCGLCQAVCPVYQITKNDCTSPRGKLILINKLLKNNQNPSEKFKQYMTMCINCKKCINYCPGGINIMEINKAFFKDFPFLGFHISSLSILIEYFINLLCKMLPRKRFSFNGEKIIYIMPYGENTIPEEIKELNCEIYKDCGIPMAFALSNPKLYRVLAKNSAKKIIEYNPDIILTHNILCKTEIQIGLNILKINKNIYNL